jgi:hypothetical protein
MSAIRLHVSFLSTVSATTTETSRELAVMPSQFLRPISPRDSRVHLRSRSRGGRGRVFDETPQWRGRIGHEDFGSAARRSDLDGEAEPTTYREQAPASAMGEPAMNVAATEKPGDSPALIAADEENARAGGREILSSERQLASGAAHDAVYARFHSMIGRVALHSANEIDRLIAELRTVQQFLETESRRVQREISAYVHLSQAAAKSSKTIVESMGQWRNGCCQPSRRHE